MKNEEKKRKEFTTENTEKAQRKDYFRERDKILKSNSELRTKEK